MNLEYHLVFYDGGGDVVAIVYSAYEVPLFVSHT